MTIWYCTTLDTAQGTGSAKTEANRVPLEFFIEHASTSGQVSSPNDNSPVSFDVEDGDTIYVKAEGVRDYAGDNEIGNGQYFISFPNLAGSFSLHVVAYADTPGDGGIAVYRDVGSPAAGFATMLSTQQWHLEGFLAVGQGFQTSPPLTQGEYVGFNVGATCATINCAAVGFHEGFRGYQGYATHNWCIAAGNYDGFTNGDDGLLVHCRATGNHRHGFHGDGDGNLGDSAQLFGCISDNNGGHGFNDHTVQTALINCTAWANGLSGFEGSARLYACLSGENGDYGYEDSGSVARPTFYCNLNPAGHENGDGGRESTAIDEPALRDVTGVPTFVTPAGSPSIDASYVNNANSVLNSAAPGMGGSASLHAALANYV